MNEWRGAFCGVSEPSHRIVQTPEEWRDLWRAIGGSPPPADLDRHFAVAVFAGLRRTGGYRVELEGPAAAGRELVIRYRVKAPEGLAPQALTQPYAVRLFPKTETSVRVEESKA